MTPLLRNSIFVILTLAAAAFFLYPPEKTVRLGKDLSGGVSLVYSVQVGPNENPDEVVTKVIDALKRRVDPNDLLGISMVRQGRDRIEVTMPLPSERVKGLKREFENELAKLGRNRLSESTLSAVIQTPEPARGAKIEELGAGNAKRLELLRAAAAAYDAMTARRAEFDAEADPAMKAGARAEAVAAAEIAYDEARAKVLKTALDADEVRRAVFASDRRRVIRDGREFTTLPSPKEAAIQRLRTEHSDPDSLRQIDDILAKWDVYAAQRQTLDDPQDLIRMLRGSGVLTFRITVSPGQEADEDRLRQELRDLGPRNVRSADKKWCKINQIENWINSKADADLLAQDPSYAAPLFARMGYVAEAYEGEFYILTWDTRTTRLALDEGGGAVSRAFPGADNLGRPAIHFTMDSLGAVRLGELTRGHVNQKMAIVLDDEVYTAPNLNSEINSDGIIQGEFSSEEIDYVVRVLSGGALKNKLSPYPISMNSVGPELGLDNLRMGLVTGLISIAIVAAFMVCYYFGFGLIAVVALLANSLVVMGAMALSKASFTMPGIAGIILTFGMAVDSNVLIYERIREELNRGADFRTAVRLGFSRALAAIVDGNMTNLIVCFALYWRGTPEIRGFAVTMGIGVVSTLFATLVVSRVIIDALVAAGWRKASMLPMAIPQLQKWLTPSVNWLRLRHVFAVMSIAYVVVSIGLVGWQWKQGKLLDTEFVGGTQVTMHLKGDPAGVRTTLTRAEVERRVRAVAQTLRPGSSIAKQFIDAEVIPVNPEADGVTSSEFVLKMPAPELEVSENPAELLGEIDKAFGDVIDSQPELKFTGADATERSAQPVYPIDKPQLGANIDRPDQRDDAREFLGGVAIVLDHLDPPPTLESLERRWRLTRESSAYSDTLSRRTKVVLLGGDARAVTSAVLLAADDSARLFDNESRWESEVRTREWNLAHDAMTKSQSPASVRSFSKSIASTFLRDAVVATIVAFFFIGVYIWVRFKTPRYGFAALVALVHDVITVMGLLALSAIIYENPGTRNFASSIGLLPFRIDLNTLAALLTIAGYSLNDTVVVMDRVRENRGKLPFATSKIINDSVNQTFSRTIITGGTTILSCIALYIWGGPGMRSFAFCLATGLIVGTYSSVAIAAPMVWSRKFDRELAADGKIVV